MNILLDTHVYLWWISSPGRLNEKAVRLISDPGNTISFSSASALEIAIKVRIGKLELPGPVSQFLPARMKRDKITEIPITIQHALLVSTLPDHHRDPFDRLLVAQAMSEGFTLLTADDKVLQYKATTVDVR